MVMMMRTVNYRHTICAIIGYEVIVRTLIHFCLGTTAHQNTHRAKVSISFLIDNG